MEVFIPLLGLLHFHRMISNSATAVTITTAPTAVAEDWYYNEPDNLKYNNSVIFTYVYDVIISLPILINKICWSGITASTCSSSCSGICTGGCSLTSYQRNGVMNCMSKCNYVVATASKQGAQELVTA